MSFRIWSAPARIQWLCLKQQQVSDVPSNFSWENKCFSLEWMQNKCPNYSASGQDQWKEKFNICALVSLWNKLSHSFPRSWRSLSLQNFPVHACYVRHISEPSNLMAGLLVPIFSSLLLHMPPSTLAPLHSPWRMLSRCNIAQLSIAGLEHLC